TTPPTTPPRAYSARTRAVANGNAVSYLPGGSGGFTVTASSTDPESGVASYAFPAAAAGWTRSLGAASATYSFSGTPSPPAGSQDVTAENGEGLVSAPAGFTVVADSAAPTGGSVAYADGWNTTGSVTV